MIELPAKVNGQRVRRKRRARTKTEATTILRELRVEAMQYGGVGDGQRLVEATMVDYLRVRDAEDLAAKTRELDRWMVAIVVGGLGVKRVNSLTVADCDRFLEAASVGVAGESGTGTPVGRSHLRRIRSTLIRAIRNDLRLGLVTSNVAELSVLPPASTSRVAKRALTYEELALLCSAAKGVIAVLIDLSGRNGLRPAEARAVRWDSIDLDAQLLRVDAQMSAENELVGPKTKGAARTIRIDGRTVELLSGWRHEQARLRAEAGPVWQEVGLVATTRTGRPIERTNVRRSLLSLSKRLGLDPPIAPYELRHTAITLQAEAGHSAWQIADWAGTSERMIADVYRHNLSAIAPLGPVHETGKQP